MFVGLFDLTLRCKGQRLVDFFLEYARAGECHRIIHVGQTVGLSQSIKEANRLSKIILL